jgi:hypothetical protein
MQPKVSPTGMGFESTNCHQSTSNGSQLGRQLDTPLNLSALSVITYRHSWRSTTMTSLQTDALSLTQILYFMPLLVTSKANSINALLIKPSCNAAKTLTQTPLISSPLSSCQRPASQCTHFPAASQITAFLQTLTACCSAGSFDYHSLIRIHHLLAPFARSLATPTVTTFFLAAFLKNASHLSIITSVTPSTPSSCS